MTKGNVPAHDMGTLSKELGRLQVVLEAYAAVTARRAEAKDLEEVCFGLFLGVEVLVRVERHGVISG